MSLFSYDDPEWPVFAALVWIATRDKGAVNQACTNVSGHGSGPALDILISARELVDERVGFPDADRVMKEFLYQAQQNELRVSGRNAGERREEIPIEKKHDWIWSSPDHKLIISLESDASQYWTALKCERQQILSKWPDQADKLVPASPSNAADKPKRGVPNTYDWPACFKYLDKKFTEFGELEGEKCDWSRQSHVIKEAQDFFSEYEQEPSASMLKKRIKAYLDNKPSAKAHNSA